MIEHKHDGSLVLTAEDGSGRTAVVQMNASDRDAQIEAFFASDLAMPSEVPMDRVRMFLIATNRLGQVTAYLNGLADPLMKKLAVNEFEYAKNFVPNDALGRSVQVALGLSDADYALAVRDMAAFSIADYGAAKPGVLKQIQKFLFGG